MSSLITTATYDYMGICDPCVRPTRQTVDPDLQAGQYHTLNCPQCGAGVAGERIHATTTYSICNADCMSAAGPSCSCACAGENHGGAFKTVHGEMLESALKRYRDRIAAKAAKADRARAAKVATFDEWAADNADVVNYLNTTDPWSDFIQDLQRQIDEYKPLSERQAAAIRKCVARKAERDARDARLNAAPRTAPTMGKQQIEGEIVSYSQKNDNYSGKLVHKLTVECGGYRVYMTMPRTLAPTSFTAIEWQEFTRALRGRRIRVTVTLAPTFRNDNPSFVLGKSPAGATLI